MIARDQLRNSVVNGGQRCFFGSELFPTCFQKGHCCWLENVALFLLVDLSLKCQGLIDQAWSSHRFCCTWTYFSVFFGYIMWLTLKCRRFSIPCQVLGPNTLLLVKFQRWCLDSHFFCLKSNCLCLESRFCCAESHSCVLNLKLAVLNPLSLSLIQFLLS